MAATLVLVCIVSDVYLKHVFQKIDLILFKGLWIGVYFK